MLSPIQKDDWEGEIYGKNVAIEVTCMRVSERVGNLYDHLLGMGDAEAYLGC